MDDGLDDLFGDVPALEIPEPLPSGLPQRVDEMSLNGCCQKLTWSKNGCIAYVSQNRRSVIIRHLLCDHNDGQWRMSKEHFLDDLSNAHNYHEIKHLAWGHTGTELAVVDAVGQISIYNVYSAIDRLTVVRRCSPDPEGHLSAVVGLMWAYSDKSGYFHQPMQKTPAGDWSFTCSQRKLLGFHNPTQRPALVVINRNGFIRVLSLGQDKTRPQSQPLLDFKTEIENTTDPSDLLTHAALCPEKLADKSTSERGTDSAILVATYSAGKELRIHRVKIDYERSIIDVHHVKMHAHCSPSKTINNGNGIDIDALPSRSRLSFLDFIPPGPRSGTKEVNPPFILAAFSDASETHENGAAQSTFATTLCRWELQTVSPKLHAQFASLSTRKSSTSSRADIPAECILKRSVDISIPRTLIAVHQANMSTIFVMLYSDGVVEYRDRMSLETLSQTLRNRFLTLGQIGFDPGFKRPCLHAAISPNLCALVSLDEQHTAAMSVMQMIGGEFLDNSFLEVVNEGFVMQGSLAAMSSVSYNDDLLATLKLFESQHLTAGSDLGILPALSDRDTFTFRFLSETYRILGLHYDYSIDSQPQHIVSNQILQRCLNTQASLAYRGASIRPSLSGSVAQIILDLRYVAFVLVYIARSKPGSDADLKNPDLVHFTTGLVSWLLAVFSFIVDETITLSDSFRDHGRNFDTIDLDLLNQHLHKTNSPAISLLMISSSRTFLRLTCVNLRPFFNAVTSQQGPGPLGLAYRELEAVFQKSLVTFAQFERLLLQVERTILGTYELAGINHNDTEQHKSEKEKRNNIEKDMLVRATIPPIMIDVVKALLTTTISNLKEEINVAELYFLDVGWLGLTNDKSCKRWREKHPLDVMKKTQLTNTAKTKRCTRCGSLAEDANPPNNKGMYQMAVILQRFCVCGSWFMVGEEEVNGSMG